MCLDGHGVRTFAGRLLKTVLEGVWGMASTLGALWQRSRRQGRGDLGGKRGIQKQEEESPRPSEAVALLCRPTPLDLRVRLSPAFPLPVVGGAELPAEEIPRKGLRATLGTGTSPLRVLCAARTPDMDSHLVLWSAGFSGWGAWGAVLRLRLHHIRVTL